MQSDTTSASDAAISTIVIVGGGSAGWMAAAALAKMLEGSKTIRLVESEEIGTVGVGEATIPQMRLFNAALGLDEAEFVRATQGSFKLGIEFVNWGALGERYIHAFGNVGQDLGMVPFHHYWLKMRRLGRADALADYTLSNVAARAGRFAPLVRALGLPDMPLAYAYHFDAGLYARYLRGYSEKLGVRRSEGKVARVELRPADGHVQALLMENGERIEGDLFIDCTGFRGLLIEQALQTGYEDWSHWLPCDRALAVPTENVGPPPPYTRSTAGRAGWQWRIPLQHRTGNGHVYCSRFISDDEASAELLAQVEGRPLAEPRPLRFVTGKRKKLWNKNVVAMGLASGFLEPLESTSIYLVQSAISRLIQFFPSRGFNAVDIAEHNRLADEEFERVRDFIILHYHQTTRTDSPFWQHCRTMEVPAELRAKIALFRSAGRLLRGPQDIFNEVSWLQVMVGQGLQPQGYHPMADLLNADEGAYFLGNIKAGIARQVAGLPSHGEYLQRYCKAPR